MENKFLDRIADAFNTDTPAPEAQTLDNYLDIILPEIQQWGEDLREMEFYQDKPWLEIRDDVGFHDTVLHFFHEDGEYLKSTNGDLSAGSWRILESNKFILEIDGMSELYDLAYLDDQYFILDKHGPQEKLGNRKHFVMMIESLGRKFEWREAMEYLFNKQKAKNNNFVIFALLILVAITIMVVFSLR